MSKRDKSIWTLGATLATLAAITAFEVVKSVLFPHLSIWRSHASTVVFCVVTVFFVSLALVRARRQPDVQVIEESKANFENLIKYMPGVTCIVDGERKFVSWNPRFQSTLGYSNAELSTMEAPLTVTEGYREAVPRRLGRAIIDGRAEMEAAWLTKSGAEIPCYLTAVRIFVQGKPCTLTIGIDLSERKAGEEALRRSEQQYRRLITNLPDLTWTMDSKLRLRYVSDNIQDILGYAREEVLGGNQTVRMHRIHPDDANAVGDRFQALFSTGELYDSQYRMRHKDGRWIWVRSRSLRTYTAEDGVLCADGILSDITERKESEEALRKSEEQFRRLLGSLPDVTWTASLNGRTTYVSDNMRDIFGYDPEDFYLESADFWSRHIHPADRHHVDEGYKAFFERRGIFDMEYRIQHKDGHWMWVHDRAIRIHEENGELFADAVVSDITARKQAEELTSHITAIVRSSADAIIGHAPDGTILSWNLAAQTMFGYSPAEIIGKHISMLVPPERMQEVPEVLARIRQGEALERFDSLCLRKDGSRCDVSLAVSPIVDKAGALLGISTIAHDISRRKRTEEALRLSQETLVKAKDAAEAANRAKTLFLANVSHELRTPINEMLGVAESMMDTGLNTTQQERLLGIQSSGQGLLHLITQLQDITKSEIGDLRIEPIPFSLRDLMRQTVRPLLAQAEQVGLEMSWSVDPSVPDWVIGDSARLRQILVNLLGNAIKFTYQGRITMGVLSVSRSEEQVELQFTVSDTGVGIPNHRHKSIFEPFIGTLGGPARAQNGTGLGLAICARLVELMGGSIWLESDLGSGTVFHFTVLLKVPATASVELPN